MFGELGGIEPLEELFDDIMDFTLLLLTCKSPWWLLLVFNELLFVNPFRPFVIAVWWCTILFVNDVIWLWWSNWFVGRDDIDGGVSKPGPYLDGDIKIGGLNKRPQTSYYVCRLGLIILTRKHQRQQQLLAMLVPVPYHEMLPDES